jgi:uncharacterized protein YkwD
MASNQFDDRVLQLINDERALVGADPLRIDRQLDQAAQLHTDNMVKSDSMEHQLSGEASLGSRISAAGYQYSSVAENIAAGQTTPEIVVQSWMGSDGHRANILNPQFTDLGIGYSDASDNKPSPDLDIYWTTNFGNPL